MSVQTRIQVRRGTLSQWNAAASTVGNGILYQGEIGYETDTGRFKIGDGSTAWASLAYASVLPSNFVAGSGISLTQGSNGSTLTISLSDPTIQLSEITDLSSDARTFLSTPSSSNLKTLVTDETGSGALVFASGATLTNTTLSGTVTIGSDTLAETIDDRVASLLTTGSGIGLNYNDAGNSLAVSVTGIPVSLITNFASGVNSLIDNAVSTSIVGGSGVDIVYSSGTNTLTISSVISAGSGVSVTHNSGVYTVGLSDPTVQLADVTDLSSDARTFLLTPSSTNLKTLVTDETGSGALVFANSPSLSNVSVSGTINNINLTTPGSAATLTLAGGKTVTVNNSLTLGGTDGSTVAFGAGGTVLYTSNKLSDLSATTSAELAGVISDETGSGSLVFANNPTMSGVTINGNLTVGGSGLVASNINDFNTAVRTNRLDQMAVPTADVSLNAQKITNLADPVSDQDAATKAYVDAARSGLDVKQSVRVATTANITLSGTQTIDDVSVIAGDRVLVKNQDTASQNGIYVVAAGAWSRATDADTSAEVTAGMFTFVAEGTTNADSGWVLTTNDTINLGTTALAFAQFSGAGQVTAGSGLVKNGNTIDVGTASSSRIVVNADNIDLATVSRSDSSGSAGATFLQSVTTDSYGRVTSSVSGVIQDASTSVKGIASFDSGDFSVTSGAVTIKSGGVDNSQLANSAVTIGSTSVSLGGSITSVSGLTSVNSTSFVGDLTGNASTATALQTARTINGTSFDGTANITISSIDGGTP